MWAKKQTAVEEELTTLKKKRRILPKHSTISKSLAFKNKSTKVNAHTKREKKLL